MYAYEWDSSTGGYILTPMPLAFSKEPRPVYYKELDILGFDKYWDYDKNDSFPYMWAEANNYYYRGRLVAKTKGGSLYTPPELVLIEDPEPEGYPLRFVDIPAMVDKNRQLMEQLVQETIKKIYNTFIEYQDKVDVFYVAFSGGKDSVVALDLVQRALPHNCFKVLFGDTGMEFPDTYETVEKIKQICAEEKIEFLQAKSKLKPENTWQIFGPPAVTIRWCCSVHKTTPQIMQLREVLQKPDFTGMAFTGVRGDESLSRSEYDAISYGGKHSGQYSCHPILEWNTAELFLYIYENGLTFNNAYKKGNTRAGCLVCPMSQGKHDYMNSHSYIADLKKTVDEFINETFNKSDRISIASIYEMLKAEPYGFMPCNLTAFILGFILKEYTKGVYSYSDNLTTVPLDAEKLASMISEIIKQDNTPEKRYKDKFIVTLTEEERAFNKATSVAFDIPEMYCVSVTETRSRIREQMKGFSFPIWVIKYRL